ncbi:virulence factor TspB C-terminal domain-related protein [Aeromonas veronii]
MGCFVGLWLAEESITSNGSEYVTTPIAGSKGYVVSNYCGIKPGGGICDYPESTPCAGDGVRHYGSTNHYLGGQYFKGYFCRIIYNSQDPIAWYSKPSDAQWDKAINRPIGLPAAFDAMKHPSMAGNPIPIESTSFTPFSEWYGDPYFKDGNWWRDRMDISPSGTPSDPVRVKVDIGPVKIEGQTNPETVPDTGPAGGTGGAPQPEKEKPTFCEANPMSIACAEMGELKDEKLEVEERPVDVSYTPWGSSTSQCPADKVIPLWEDQSITISYSPVCQFASLLRPLVIALAFVAAGFIVAGITRKGAES